ncbi:MAG: c(7)-type cytochrome triheme domain-containing protein [Acidobacteriota bacterium]
MRFRPSSLIVLALSLFTVGCGSSSPSSTTSTTKETAPAPAKEPPPVAAAPATTPTGAPPVTILFETTYGNVTYTHQKHYERLKNDCSTCHPSIFPQAREPLNYGKARHRVAEEYQKSCAHCHNVVGTAFAAERNCQKCHAMGGEK